MEIQYNGVSLPFVTTESFSSTPVYEGGGYVHTRHVFTCRFVLSRSIPGLLFPGESFAACVARVKHALEYPRRALSLQIGGQTLLSTAGIDCANGPIPGAFTINRLDGVETAICNWTVTCHTRDCPDDEPGTTHPGYTSHVWRDSVTIGADLYTTRTRSGKLTVRSDFGRDPDAFRYLVTPPLLPGFLRKSSRYAVADDGLSLSYDFEDAESWAVPPAPAVEADGEFRLVTVSAAKMVAEVSVRLVGGPATDKAALLATAVAVAMERLDRANPGRATQTRPEPYTGSVSERLYKNEVTVALRCNLVAGAPAATGTQTPSTAGVIFRTGLFILNPAAGALAMLTRPGSPPAVPTGRAAPAGFADLGFSRYPLGSRPDANGRPPLSPDPGLRSAAGLHLVAVALQDPCLVETIQAELRNTGQAAVGSAVLSAGQRLAPGSPNAGTLTTVLTGSVSPATVGILDPGVAPADPVTPALTRFDKAVSGGIYTFYDLSLKVVETENRGMVATQGPGAKTFYPQLAAATTTVEVTWSAARCGEPPALFPSAPPPGPPVPAPPPPPGSPMSPPSPGEPNLVLLKKEYSPGAVELGEDGVTLEYHLAGKYTYGVIDPALFSPAATLEPFLWKRMGGLDRPVVWDGPKIVDPATGGVFTGWAGEVAALQGRADAENP